MLFKCVHGHLFMYNYFILYTNVSSVCVKLINVAGLFCKLYRVGQYSIIAVFISNLNFDQCLFIICITFVNVHKLFSFDPCISVSD